MLTRSTMTAYGFEAIDLVALVFFFATWCMYSWIVNGSRWRVHTISYRMEDFRRQWMRNMAARDMRMVDALIQNNLQQGVLFFASTSILLIGGLLAGVGAADKAMQVLGDIPLSSTNTRTEWEVKVLLVVFILMFAFFKFAWAYRLFNYVIIMIGAAPEGQRRQEHVVTDEQVSVRGVDGASAETTDRPASGKQATGVGQNRYADKVAQLHAIGARHFTSGLSAYFFALSALMWFVNAWVFIVASVWVSLVLYRRAFRSNFMKILEV